MPSIFDTNDPLTAAYLSRNPTSILGMAAAAAMRMKNQASVSDNVIGSNNAGGLASPETPSMNEGAFGPNMASRGGFSLGGSIVSFAEGGMMDEQGRAIRPGDGMRPPSAGTGRTLPSARFKVDAQPPQAPSMMPSGGPALGAASPAPMDSAQIEQEAQRFVQQHPQEVQKIQEVIAVAMQMGELTPEELNMAVQLAKTALARPESYPQIRQFAIQNGLGTEQDIPQQMDQGLLYVLIVAGKSMQNGAPPSGNAMQGQGPSPTQNSVVPEYSDGGMTGDKPHIAKLHAREYVIPEDAVLYWGKKHLDGLVEKARTPPDDGTN